MNRSNTAGKTTLFCGYFLVLCCVSTPLGEWPQMFWTLFAGGMILVEVFWLFVRGIDKMGKEGL